jgi:putative transposase
VSVFIDEHRERFGVEPICETLDVSASAYYQRATGERSARRIEDERLIGRIREVHAANYECYGYRRTHAQLVREGETAGRDQVARLMAAGGIQGAKRRGKPWRTTTADPEAQRPADLVMRDFTATAPDRLWVTDFTYLRCWEGRAFFSFVIDVFSRMIVGWQLAGHMRTDLVLDALRPALTSRWCRTATPARSTPVRTTPRRWTITSCSRRSGPSATAMTTRWPRASSTASRPS